MLPCPAAFGAKASLLGERLVASVAGVEIGELRVGLLLAFVARHLLDPATGGLAAILHGGGVVTTQEAGGLGLIHRGHLGVHLGQAGLGGQLAARDPGQIVGALHALGVDGPVLVVERAYLVALDARGLRGRGELCRLGGLHLTAKTCDLVLASGLADGIGSGDLFAGRAALVVATELHAAITRLTIGRVGVVKGVAG